MNDFEIMAPVGSRESLAAAIQGGADSIYFGIANLNMRARSANTFTIDDLREIARTCDEHGMKSYLTVNTIIYDNDLELMRTIVDAAKEAGISAVIAADVAVMSYARRIGQEVHLSTQLNISNIEALRFYAQFADVVVLARELNLEQVAEIYQRLAVDLHTGKKETYFARRDALIASYKAEGRRGEIQNALSALKKEYTAKEPDVPDDLCWLYGSFLDDYLHDVEICQRFARRNREKMAEILLGRTGMTALEAFHTVHNYIDTGERILRKGAIAAHAGEKVLIPINMRDGSVLAVGKGNPEWNYSAPHGAGRIMSRAKAKEALSLAEYTAAMDGIYTTSVNRQTIDEAPMAYKSLDDILPVIGESVDILDVMKPVYSFKASEEDAPRKKKRPAAEERVSAGE